VCSNSIRGTIEVMMEKSALAGYLDFMISNQDVARPKPDPEMYATAIQRFGLTPRECLVVEDNDNGIKAAEASGAYVMAVQDVSDVTYTSIVRRIGEIGGSLAP
jgi:beta-phosphoglucomutase